MINQKKVVILKKVDRGVKVKNQYTLKHLMNLLDLLEKKKNSKKKDNIVVLNPTLIYIQMKIQKELLRV